MTASVYMGNLSLRLFSKELSTSALHLRSLMNGGSRALTTRFLDFWLLGGASLVVWAGMTVSDAWREDPAIEERFGDPQVRAYLLD